MRLIKPTLTRMLFSFASTFIFSMYFYSYVLEGQLIHMYFPITTSSTCPDYPQSNVGQPLCSLREQSTPTEDIFINIGFVLISFCIFYLCVCLLTFFIHKLWHQKR